MESKPNLIWHFETFVKNLFMSKYDVNGHYLLHCSLTRLNAAFTFRLVLRLKSYFLIGL